MSSPYPAGFTELDTVPFDQRLAILDGALPAAEESIRELLLNLRASVVRIQAELNGFRIPAPFFGNQARIVCFDCGRKNLQVFYTSKYGGYQLCASCYGMREQHGQARPGDDCVKQ
jgi:hypothetical protein